MSSTGRVLQRGEPLLAAGATVSIVSSTDSVVCDSQTTFSGSRTVTLSTSSGPSTSVMCSGASPEVPTTSSWPSWPMSRMSKSSSAKRHGLAVHLGHQRAGRVDRLEAAGLGLLVDDRGDAVGGEDDGGALGHLVGLVDEDRAALLERRDDVLVVHDLLAHVDGRRRRARGPSRRSRRPGRRRRSSRAAPRGGPSWAGRLARSSDSAHWCRIVRERVPRAPPHGPRASAPRALSLRRREHDEPAARQGRRHDGRAALAGAGAQSQDRRLRRPDEPAVGRGPGRAVQPARRHRLPHPARPRRRHVPVGVGADERRQRDADPARAGRPGRAPGQADVLDQARHPAARGPSDPPGRHRRPARPSRDPQAHARRRRGLRRRPQAPAPLPAHTASASITGRNCAAEKDVVENARRRWPAVALRDPRGRGPGQLGRHRGGRGAPRARRRSRPSTSSSSPAAAARSRSCCPSPTRRWSAPSPQARTPVDQRHRARRRHRRCSTSSPTGARRRRPTPARRSFPDAAHERALVDAARDRVPPGAGPPASRRSGRGCAPSSLARSWPTRSRSSASDEQEVAALRARATTRMEARLHRAADQAEHLRRQVVALSPSRPSSGAMPSCSTATGASSWTRTTSGWASCCGSAWPGATSGCGPCRPAPTGATS